MFPSIDDLVKIIYKKGPGCLLFKRDLSQAYRQLRVDVGSVNLLGYYFKDIIILTQFCPWDLGPRQAVAKCLQTL